jgi:hypothetical protein
MQVIHPDNPKPKRPGEFDQPEFPQPLFLVQKTGETVQEFRARALQEINALPNGPGPKQASPAPAQESPKPKRQPRKKAAPPPAPASE